MTLTAQDASRIVPRMTGITSNEEFDRIRDQMADCSEQDREMLSERLADAGKLEITPNGNRYVFAEYVMNWQDGEWWYATSSSEIMGCWRSCEPVPAIVYRMNLFGMIV